MYHYRSVYSTVMELSPIQLESLATCDITETLRELKLKFPNCFKGHITAPILLDMATTALSKAIQESGCYEPNKFTKLDLVILAYLGRKRK